LNLNTFLIDRAILTGDLNACKPVLKKSHGSMRDPFSLGA